MQEEEAAVEEQASDTIASSNREIVSGAEDEYIIDEVLTIGNELGISDTSGMGNLYVYVGVYRHFLRTGEMTEGVENSFFGEGGIWDMHTGTLVDMQLGKTVETPYGSAYIVKGLWKYDILTEVTETVIFKVNDREVIITYNNRNAEPGVTLDSYEGQLAGMLAEMF